MAKPYICFCGDKEKCRIIMKNCGKAVRTVFISEANSDRLLVSPSRHPSFICMILSRDMCANTDLFKKIYRYVTSTRCPMHIVGSRRNMETILKYVPELLVQRSDSSIIIDTINNLCEYISSNPDAEFSALKSRFRTIAVISDKATSMALCENMASLSEVKPRIIFSTPGCPDKEFEQLKNENLSGIITDRPLSSNTILLSENTGKEKIPVTMLDKHISYGRKIKVVHIDSKNESDQISRIITDHEKRKSKLLFIRSKKKTENNK